MRFIASLALGLLIPASMMASDSGVVQQLRQDLVGKDFTLAIDVAGYACVYTGDIRIPMTRMIDTEIFSGGSTPRYFLRSAHLSDQQCSPVVGKVDLGTGMYIDRDMISHMNGRGGHVSVKLVEAKPDRIEIQLTPEGEMAKIDSYAKLKLMLGKGYESRSLEQVELVLASALVLPRINSIQVERANLEVVQNSIARLERNLSTENNAEIRIDKATRLIGLYQEQAGTQEHLNRVAFEPVSVELVTSRITELKTIISEGQRQSQIDRIQKASQEYASATLLMRASCRRIDSSPARNRSELNNAVATVETAKQNMETFRRAQSGIETLGRVVSSDDEEFRGRCLATSDAVERTFKAQWQSIFQAEAQAAELQRKQEVRQALVHLNTEFAKMRQQRTVLDSKLIGVLGTSDEAGAFASYRNHLEVMLENRQQALALGQRSVEPEIRALEEQMRKLR